jgi:hypothetical protein
MAFVAAVIHPRETNDMSRTNVDCSSLPLIFVNDARGRLWKEDTGLPALADVLALLKLNRHPFGPS